MGDPVLNVNLVLDNRTITVPYSNITTAEDVCIHICKQLNIGSLTRHLFALRVTGKSIFLMPATTFGEKSTSVDFRIRFKVTNIAKLLKLDINTYNYYFHQARNDVLENKIPDIIYEKYRRELVGLGITDMYRVMLEKDIPRGSVENDYKKYIPKEVLKRHPFFIKKPIHDTLGKLQKSVNDASYVKAEYLRQLENIAPEYLSETYKAIIEQDGDDCNITIKLSPYDPTKPGLKYYMDSKKDWQLICSIEDLGVVSIRNHDSIEISRRNGIPFYLKFHSRSIMYSFISLLDGYYRLTCKWTFSICREVYTPSLQKLYAMKCHGPVGGEFSYAKLEAKRANRAGCFIIRESESKYNNYYIDVCLKDGLKPKTFKLEKITGDEFIFNDDLTRYKSIHQLMAAYDDPNGAIYLHECLPPSEYDDSPLLLCKSESMVGDSLTDSSTLNVLMPASPMCINCKDLQVYKGTYCYVISLSKEKKIKKHYCHLRKCKSEQCRMAGTGNDYIGTLNITRSNRTCGTWDFTNTSLHNSNMQIWNGSLFADMSASAAKNYCRNPSRDVSGSWCYTSDPNVLQDSCNVRDCDKPEECITIVEKFMSGRRIYILPQWKEIGIHGGLRFAIKQWNPDLVDGLMIIITPRFGSRFISLQIGAEKNEKIFLYYDGTLIEQKTFPHIIAAGKWTELWLQIRKGEIMLGFEGVPTSLFEWQSEKTGLEFEPMFLNYGSITGNPIGLFFKCDECHTENTTTDSLTKYHPIGLWSSSELPFYNNLTLRIRGKGVMEVTLMAMPGTENFYSLRIDSSGGQKKEGSRGITVVFRSMWKVAKGKKIEVAMKMLKEDSADHYLKDMLTLAGQWAFLQSNVLVRLYGIAFTSNISLVLEYFKLGPLDQYLRKNRSIVQTVDLIQAASNLASALWHLTENDIVHGNIRCRKLMVKTHEANSFTVKLTDPGIHTSYASSEVHWIPIECYSNLNYAKRSSEADVWSFATTLWEIFMFGEEINPIDHGQAMRWYISGKRLPKPPSCSNEIYTLMKECWDIDPHKRKKPQAIMRDINQILYQVYNSRRPHPYETVLNKPIEKDIRTSRDSLTSVTTESTAVLVDFTGASDSDNSGGSSLSVMGMKYPDSYDDSDSYDLPNILSRLTLSTATTSVDSLNSIFELDENCNVVLQGRIGQGFYGEVYKGSLEYVTGQNEEPKMVAVKKLKAAALSSCLQDFEREINIMKSLNHPNIVEILGVKREPEICLVMEFVQHGSLQSYLKIYRESLQEEQLLKYALDIAKGMDYLGKKNIVHRDLAARNILVVDENHVKISDFGLAQVMGANDYYILKTPNRELPIKWYAPESLRDGKFSTRSDVWSYGVTMCETFNYGEEPNLAVNEEIEGPQQQILLTALEKGARFPCPPNCPKAVYIRIIYPCWQADPHRRPLFSQLIMEIEDLFAQK